MKDIHKQSDHKLGCVCEKIYDYFMAKLPRADMQRIYDLVQLEIELRLRENYE